MTPDARTLDFYDRHVCEEIINKYGFSEMDAIRSFLFSETYQMLLDKETAVYQMSHLILFDMWENEKVTGNPRTSIYIRTDVYDKRK